MTPWKLLINFAALCLLPLMTLQPVTASSQTDSLICLPVEVIDSTIIELQELDYLRDKSELDQELIENLELQVETLDSTNTVADIIIKEESEKTSLWKDEAESQRNEKEWWKWGGITLSAILIILSLQ